MTTVAAARQAVDAAEAKIADGKREREEALVLLDEALAERGWRRLVGGFTAGAEPLYESAETGEVFAQALVVEAELNRGAAA
jgi:hypothetical protein